MEYYLDDVHLSQKAMPFVLDEFKHSIPDMDFSDTLFTQSRRTALILFRRVISKLQRIVKEQ